MLNYKQETCHNMYSDTQMYVNLSILEFSADKPHGYQFLYALLPFFLLQLLPPTQEQHSWIPPLVGEKKKKKILRRQLKTV